MDGSALSRLWIVGALLACAGLVLALAGDGTVDVIGFVLNGLGLVLLAGWAFYAIGRSEDRDRERDRARRPPR